MSGRAFMLRDHTMGAQSSLERRLPRRLERTGPTARLAAPQTNLVAPSSRSARSARRTLTGISFAMSLAACGRDAPSPAPSIAPSSAVVVSESAKPLSSSPWNYQFEKPRPVPEIYPLMGTYKSVQTLVKGIPGDRRPHRFPCVVHDNGTLVVTADALLFYDVKDARQFRDTGKFTIESGPLRWRSRVVSWDVDHIELYACLVVDAEPVPHQAPRLGECRLFDFELGSYDGDVAIRSEAITELYGIEALVPGIVTHSLRFKLLPWSTDLPPFDGAPP